MPAVSPRRHFELTLTIRNNLLKERRLALGMSQEKLAEAVGIPLPVYGGFETLKLDPRVPMPRGCAAPGCPWDHGTMGMFCDDHRRFSKEEEKEIWRDIRERTPRKYSDLWTPYAQRLADFHCCRPEEIFPEEVLGLPAMRFVRKLDRSQLVGLSYSETVALPPDERFDSAELGRQVALLLGELTPRQAAALRTRLGFDDGREKGFDESAKILGISSDRVRQLQTQALRKLRHPTLAKRLSGWRVDK